MEMKKIGERIKDSREKWGYTIEELADEANISHATMVAIENGSYFPNIEVLLPIIEALDESPSYIVFNIRNPRAQGLYNKFADKLERLTPQQLQTVEDIVDAYIKNL